MQKISFIISQDGEVGFGELAAHADVTVVVDSFVDEVNRIGFHAERINHPKMSTSVLKTHFEKNAKPWKLTFGRLSFHYKWALQKVFNEMGAQRVIIMEDDMVTFSGLPVCAFDLSSFARTSQLTSLSSWVPSHPYLTLMKNFWLFLVSSTMCFNACGMIYIFMFL